MSREHIYLTEPLLFTALRVFEPESELVRLALSRQSILEHLHEMTETMAQPWFNQFVLAHAAMTVLEADVARRNLDPLSELR